MAEHSIYARAMRLQEEQEEWARFLVWQEKERKAHEDFEKMKRDLAIKNAHWDKSRLEAEAEHERKKRVRRKQRMKVWEGTLGTIPLLDGGLTCFPEEVLIQQSGFPGPRRVPTKRKVWVRAKSRKRAVELLNELTEHRHGTMTDWELQKRFTWVEHPPSELEGEGIWSKRGGVFCSLPAQLPKELV